MVDEQQLLKLKEKIDKAKQDYSRQQGIQESAEKGLKELGVNNVEEAQDMIEEIEAEIEELEAEYAELIRKVEEALSE